MIFNAAIMRKISESVARNVFFDREKVFLIKNEIVKASLEGAFHHNISKNLTEEEVDYFKELGFRVTKQPNSTYWTFKWG